MTVAVKFSPGIDQHVFGKTDSSQTPLGTLHPADGAFVAVAHDDHQVYIAVFGRRSPSVRAEKPDLLRLEFRSQSFDRTLQKAWADFVHSARLTS